MLKGFIAWAVKLFTHTLVCEYHYSMINHALFSAPFRPFFWFGTVVAILWPMYWVCILVNGYPFPDSFIDPLDWHAFEMIYGFSLAIIAGFLLTASSHWTDTPMLTKGPLILMFFFWGLERVLFFIPNLSGNIILVLNFPFLSLLLAHLYKKFSNDRKKFLVFGGALSILLILKILFLLGVQYNLIDFIYFSKEISIHVITFIIVLVTGKILPFFTSKACPEITVTNKPRIEILSKLIIIILVFTPLIPKNDLFQSILLLAACLIHGVRWLSWSPFKTRKVFLLFSLHIGYAWLIIYFLLRGLGYFYQDLNFGAAALHAFTMGALGILILAMMTRVSLGHTGRELIPGKSFYIAIFLVNAGALLRVLVPIINSDFYLTSLHWSMGLWTFGFLIYLISFTPILWKKNWS